MDEKKDGFDQSMLSEEDREMFDNMSPEEQEMAKRIALKMNHASRMQEKSEKASKKKDSDDLSESEHRALIEAMLPGGNLKPLYESETCLLCDDEDDIRKRTCYAVTDMGHQEPPGTKPSALMLRVKTKVGSIVPLQIACCDRCKRNHRIASFMQMATMIVIMGLALLVMSRPAVSAKMYEINEALGLILFVLLLPVSYLIGKLLMRAFRTKAGKKTRFDIRDLPLVQQMMEREWFPLNKNATGEPVIIFSKERLKKGWFTD